MSSTKFSGVSFAHASNAKRTEQQFVDKWVSLVWLNVRADNRVALLREAYSIIRKDAGVPIEAHVQETEKGNSAQDIPDGDAATEQKETEEIQERSKTRPYTKKRKGGL